MPDIKAPGAENTSRGVLAGNKSPEEYQSEIDALTKRLAALEPDNVVEPEFAGEAPLYLLNEAIFADDQWFAPGTVIEYIGPVNLTMVPKNEPARARMREYLTQIEAQQRHAAELHGRPFRSVITDADLLRDLATASQRTSYNNVMTGAADAGKFPMTAMPVDRSLVPEMPHTEEALARLRRIGRQKKVSVRESTNQELLGEQPKHVVVKDRA